MKQYIMGMITGASLIVCAFMFMGNAAYYDIDDVYSKLSDVESTVSDVKSTVSDIEYDVRKIKRTLSYGVDCN